MEDSFILNELDDSFVMEEVVTSNRWTCAICGYKTTWKSNCTRHLKSHSLRKEGESSTAKNYICDICEYATSDKSNFYRHLKVHAPEKVTTKTYVCDTCGRTFASRSSVDTHSKTVHLKIFKYNCGVCSKGYNQKAAYTGLI